jgi:2-iminobutanoate/2-iminopropanoate deaminase
MSEHPYSLALKKNGLIYISGATTIDYTTHKPIPGRREALDAALDEVERRLNSVDAKLSDVVKVTYFLRDISMRNEANQQFQDRFFEPRPARTVVGVSDIPYGGVAVIEVIADVN